MDLPITRLLRDARSGNRDALDRLFSLVYDELKLIARARLRGRRQGTLDTTALVHEAYLRLFEGGGVDVSDRGHFYALSSRAMRHVLVDHFRRRGALKRGGAAVVLATLGGSLPQHEAGEAILGLDDLLEQLERLEPRLARVVEYRFFGGMTEVEIGQVLNVSDRTVRNDWRKARAWLARELVSGGDDDPHSDGRA